MSTTQSLGELIPAYEGTLEHFAGDGVMVFFNDPVPVEGHELQAIRLALAAQAGSPPWRRAGGSAESIWGSESGSRPATRRWAGSASRAASTTARSGRSTNLASRLSTHASPGQILIGQRIFAATEEAVETTPVGSLELKGFARPVVAYEVKRLR